MLAQPESAAQGPRCIEVDLAELPRHGDLLGSLLAGRLRALIVRGAYPPQMMADAIERLRRGMEGVPVFRPHTIHSGAVYGWPLVACQDALDEYLELAARFDATCRHLFGEPL